MEDVVGDSCATFDKTGLTQRGSEPGIYSSFRPVNERSMKTFFATLIFVLPLFCASNVYAGDGFEDVRCGSDVVKALRGHKTSNEPVVKIEARHQDLQLKDLGADIISDDERLNLIFWRICGEEYAVLQEGNIVEDALKLPKHSKDTPQFEGSCQLNGKDLPGVVLGVLKYEEGAAKLPAVKVWKIDEKQKKFVELPTEGLRCGPDGILSEDTRQ